MPGKPTDAAERAFSGTPATKESAPEVPERIRQHAPVPALKPGGGWSAQRDQVEQSAREQNEAQKAKAKWAARSPRKGKRLGAGFSKASG